MLKFFSWEHLCIESRIFSIQIDPFAFERLRGFRIDLTIRNTSIRNFSAPIIRRMSGVSFLHLSLANNRLETLPPLFADVSSAPLLNRHGTILSELDLRVRIAERKETDSLRHKCYLNYFWALFLIQVVFF